jgi:hypothetical protein
MKYIEESVQFLATELASVSLEKELQKLANIYPWIEDDASSCFFELTLGKIPDSMQKIALIVSKTYSRV